MINLIPHPEQNEAHHKRDFCPTVSYREFFEIILGRMTFDIILGRMTDPGNSDISLLAGTNPDTQGLQEIFPHCRYPTYVTAMCVVCYDIRVDIYRKKKHFLSGIAQGGVSHASIRTNLPKSFSSVDVFICNVSKNHIPSQNGRLLFPSF